MNTQSARLRRHRRLIESQGQVLQLIADGAPLERVLERLVALIEEQLDVRCAVLLADRAQTRLRFVAAPSLPEEYKRGIEPLLRIGPDVGSCGTAAWLRQAVYTGDTATDPRWKDARDITLRHGLSAVWSTPIVGDGGVVLGTFAMYYGKPRLPSAEHIQFIEMATQVARIAIEDRDDALVDALFDTAPDGLAVVDLTGTLLRVNRVFAEALGYEPAGLLGRDVAQLQPEPGHEALVQRLTPLSGQVLTLHRRYRSRDGHTVRVREQTSLRRDPEERPVLLTRLEKIIGIGDGPLDRLSAREAQVLALVMAGHTSREIGLRLRIAPASVDTYRSRIMTKLGVDNLAGLVQVAIEHGAGA